MVEAQYVTVLALEGYATSTDFDDSAALAPLGHLCAGLLGERIEIERLALGRAAENEEEGYKEKLGRRGRDQNVSGYAASSL